MKKYKLKLPFFDYDPGDKERLKRIEDELKIGFSFLERLKNDRVVSVFGSHLDKPKDKEYRQAKNLGQLLAKEKILVLTGGGPGIMEAANRGALEANGRSLGINLELGKKEQRNKYVKEAVSFHYLFVRKVMLAHAAQAYVFFPGGFGTLDEFFEIATLMITGKISKNIPIILIGRDYWASLEKWMKDILIKKHQAINPKDLLSWKIVNNEREAAKILKRIPALYPKDESI